MKIDLTDVTFTIPIRIDTSERLRNIKTCVEYLNTHFNTNILVFEDSPSPQAKDVLNGQNCQYFHIKNDNPLFHRTKLLNDMARIANTNIIVNYDADVVLKVNQYVAARETIRTGAADMVYPYGGKFVDIYNDVLNTFLTTKNVESLSESNGNILHPQSLGGAVFWNKQKFFSVGMENEKFVSWGWEDNCRLVIAQKLGLRIARVQGPLFHMHHPPSQNSANVSHKPYFDNEQEFNKINHMTIVQLKEYISTWSWAK